MARTLVLSILFILLSISFASFSRPWLDENWVDSNPNIWTYGMEYWWNLPEFDKTINSIDFDQLPNLQNYPKIKNYIEQTKNYGETSQKNMNDCIFEVIVAVGSFSPSATFFSAFANSSDCRTYKKNWVKSVDYALLALEESDSAAKKAISSARASYENIKFLGLCDKDYSDFGSDNCNNISIIFTIIDNNLSEGTYGQYPMFLQYHDQVQEELLEPTPDLSLSDSMLYLIFGDNGTLDVFEKLKNSSDKLTADAEKEFQFRLQKISIQKSQTEQRISELKKADFGLITDGVKSSSTTSVGSISEIFYGLEKESQDLGRIYSETIVQHGHSTEQSYLSNSLSMTTSISTKYSDLFSKLELLKDGAVEVLLQKQQEAEEEISNTEDFFMKIVPSPEGLQMLETAKEKLETGKSASTAGTAFVLYSKSAAFARSARNTGKFEDQVQTNILITKLEHLILMAEKDGINVVDEKESLTLLKSLEFPQKDQILLASIDNIILKAKSKYEANLLMMRTEIKEKISLIGPVVGLISKDMEDYEFGLIKDDEIIFPDAIGSLKKLKLNYESVELALDEYTSVLVSNSMTTKTSPIFGQVWFDKPTDVFLDIVLVNGPYSASNVKVQVDIGSKIPFFYSDIVTGKDEVTSLFDTGNQLFFVLKNVEPFDIKRITLQKSLIISHILSNEHTAEGVGNGLVRIYDKINFELDYQVSKIEVPYVMENCMIDDLPNPTLLSTGKHELRCEKTIYGYDQQITNIKTSMSGTKTKIEYEITISSDFDLSTLLVQIDNTTGSQISSLQAVVSGATLKEKKNSGSQVSVVISDVKKDQTTTMYLSYLVDDPENYIMEKINQIPNNNQSEVEDLLESAKEQSVLGNYENALKLVEEAKTTSNEYTKQQTKLETKYGDLSKKATNEINLIEKTLPDFDVNTSVYEKLKTRMLEMEKVLEDNSTMEDKLTLLESFDFNWLSKEVTSFKKEAYKEFNNLKERFYRTGNFSTPPEFLALENAIIQLETTGQVEYLSDVSNALENAKFLVENEELAYKKSQDSIVDSFSLIKSNILHLLDSYNTQASAAKGTEYSNLFTESGTKLVKLLDDAEKLIGKDVGQFTLKLDEITKSEDKMQFILESLKEETETKILTISSLLASRQFDQSKKPDLETKFQSMQDLASKGDYVNALRAGNIILGEFEVKDPEPNNILLFSVTALAILSGAGFYLLNQNKPKELKKLPTADEAI
ncbi:MAG: hypothetical protein ABH842_03545 [Candidatus Micrarchaeota archaeon]